MEEGKKKMIPFWGKTEKKRANIMIYVDGKEAVFPVKLNLQEK